MISSITEGEGGAFFVRYDMFFPLDSQVARIFCLKKCLTTLRVVTGFERGQSAVFLKMVVG